MSAGRVIDVDGGHAVLTDQDLVLIPFQDLITRSRQFMMWVSNDSAKPIEVEFQASPCWAPVALDMETIQTVTCAPGRSVSLCRKEELYRYWAVGARCPTYVVSDVIAVRFGIVMDLDR